MRHARTNTGYTRIARHLAGLIAFVFALVSVVASQHHHRPADLPVAETFAAFSATAVVHADAVFGDATPRHADAAHHSALCISRTDCATCAWLSTGVTTPGIPAAIVVVALSGIVTLLLFVRFAALCAAPAPRRGLRAPPLVLA